MVFKKHLPKMGRRGTVHAHVGKGATEEVLPSRHAVQTLTSGDPSQRTMQQYAKLTPMANPRVEAPDIQGL